MKLLLCIISLALTVLSVNGFQVYLKYPDETYDIYTINGKDSIGQLKQKVYQRSQIAYDQQRIYFENHELSDDKTYDDHHLYDGCYLQLKIVDSQTESHDGHHSSYDDYGKKSSQPTVTQYKKAEKKIECELDCDKFERCRCRRGPPGIQGRRGLPGAAGVPGAPGAPGPSGLPGESCTVVNITVGGACGANTGVFIVCPDSTSLICNGTATPSVNTLEWASGFANAQTTITTGPIVLGQGIYGITNFYPEFTYVPGVFEAIILHQMLDSHALLIHEPGEIRHFQVNADIWINVFATPDPFDFNITFYVAYKPLDNLFTSTVFPGYELTGQTVTLNFVGTLSTTEPTIVSASGVDLSTFGFAVPMAFSVMANGTLDSNDPWYFDINRMGFSASLENILLPA